MFWAITTQKKYWERKLIVGALYMSKTPGFETNWYPETTFYRENGTQIDTFHGYSLIKILGKVEKANNGDVFHKTNDQKYSFRKMEESTGSDQVYVRVEDTKTNEVIFAMTKKEVTLILGKIKSGLNE